MYSDLQEFLNALEREGELLRLRAGDGGAWSPILEITELADMQSKMKCAKESGKPSSAANTAPPMLEPSIQISGTPGPRGLACTERYG